MLPGVVILVIGGLFLWQWGKKRSVKWFEIVIVLLVGILYLFSTPWLANKMVSAIENSYPVLQESQKNQYHTIIIFGSGIVAKKVENATEYFPSQSAYPKLFEAIKLYRLSQHKNQVMRIYITGGSGQKKVPEVASEAYVYKKALVEAGVLSSDIYIETSSQTTNQNVTLLIKKIGKDSLMNSLIVTSALQMPRVMEKLHDAGVVAVADPVGFIGQESQLFNLFQWLPQASALNQSMLSIHEFLGRYK